MLSETTRKIFLIVDRLRAHEAKRGGLGRGASGSDRAILPARYAPERNADEYLNNDMKGSIKRLACRGVKRGCARGFRVP